LVEIQTVDDDRVHLFSEKFACADCGISIEEISPRLFSFNSPYGACPKCSGLGTLMEPDESLVIPDPGLSIREGVLAPWAHITDESDGRERHGWQNQMMKSMAKHYHFRLDVPFRKLASKVRELLLFGNDGEKFPVMFKSKSGSTYSTKMAWEG